MPKTLSEFRVVMTAPDGLPLMAMVTKKDGAQSSYVPDGDTFNGSFMYGGHKVLMHMGCNCKLENGKPCGIQTHGLYCFDPSVPDERACWMHYKKKHKDDHNDEFYPSMSITLNEICERMGATFEQRNFDFSLQHLNRFLGDRCKSFNDLMTDSTLLSFLECNCSRSACKRIKKRTLKLAPAWSLASFHTCYEQDEDPSASYDPEHDSDAESECESVHGYESADDESEGSPEATAYASERDSSSDSSDSSDSDYDEREAQSTNARRVVKQSGTCKRPRSETDESDSPVANRR